jgi:hypothetical protein
MTWTTFWTGIGNMFEWCFKVIKHLGNKPNAILWVLIFFLLCFWVMKMMKQNKEAARNGTLK